MSILSRFIDGLINTKKRRKQNNDYVLKLLKNGDNLAVISNEATWFPPRTVLKKLFFSKKKDAEFDEYLQRKGHLYLVK